MAERASFDFRPITLKIFSFLFVLLRSLLHGRGQVTVFISSLLRVSPPILSGIRESHARNDRFAPQSRSPNAFAGFPKADIASMVGADWVTQVSSL